MPDSKNHHIFGVSVFRDYYTLLLVYGYQNLYTCFIDGGF